MVLISPLTIPIIRHPVADDAHTPEETARILEKMRLRDLPTSQSLQPPGGGLAKPSINTSSRDGKSRPLGGGDSDDSDVDHALEASLKPLRGNMGSKRTAEGERGKGQVITIEWDERMEAMSKDKAEAEARAGRCSAQSSPMSLVFRAGNSRMLTHSYT